MLPEWVTAVLKENGVAGAIVMVLLLVIVALSGVIVHLYKREGKVYGYRLAERDTLKDALNAASVAAMASSKASEDRNEVTEELADAMAKLAGAMERLQDRIEMQHIMLKDQFSDFKVQLKEHGGTITTASGTYDKVVQEIRNFLAPPTRRPR